MRCGRVEWHWSCASDWICGLSRMRRSAHCTSQAPLAPLLTGWISEGLSPQSCAKPLLRKCRPAFLFGSCDRVSPLVTTTPEVRR